MGTTKYRTCSPTLYRRSHHILLLEVFIFISKCTLRSTLLNHAQDWRQDHVTILLISRTTSIHYRCSLRINLILYEGNPIKHWGCIDYRSHWLVNCAGTVNVYTTNAASAVLPYHVSHWFTLKAYNLLYSIQYVICTYSEMYKSFVYVSLTCLYRWELVYFQNLRHRVIALIELRLASHLLQQEGEGISIIFSKKIEIDHAGVHVTVYGSAAKG